MLAVSSRGIQKGGLKPKWPFSLNRNSSQADRLINWYPLNKRHVNVRGSLQQFHDFSLSRNHLTVNLASSGSTATRVTHTPICDLVACYIATNEHSRTPLYAQSPSVFTLSCWNYYISAPQATYATLWGTNAEQGLCCRTSSSRMGSVVGGVLYQSSGGGYELRRWRHAAMSWDGANIRWYINGMLDSTVTPASGSMAYPWSTTAGIGGTSAGRTFGGFICDVRGYDTVLTDGQIWAMYNPSTRWELYYQPRRKVWFTSAAAPPAPTNQGATLPMMGV